MFIVARDRQVGLPNNLQRRSINGSNGTIPSRHHRNGVRASNAHRHQRTIRARVHRRSQTCITPVRVDVNSRQRDASLRSQCQAPVLRNSSLEGKQRHSHFPFSGIAAAGSSVERGPTPYSESIEAAFSLFGQSLLRCPTSWQK